MRLNIKVTKTDKIPNPNWDRNIALAMAKEGKEYNLPKLITEIKRVDILLNGDQEIVQGIVKLISAKYEVG